MLLRSITGHVKTQNWFAVGIDFVIVVIGVYIGIQVSNWNEARLESERGEYFAARLVEDIRQEFTIYEAEREYYSTVHDYALRAVVLLDSDEPGFDNELVVSAYNATQYFYAEPARSTYDELLATGNLYLLEDENLRNASLFLYNSTNRLRLSSYVLDSAYRERVRRVMRYDVQQAVREQCGDVIDDVSGFSSGIPASCRIDFPRASIVAAATALRNDPEIRSDLAFFLSSLGYFISDVASVRRQAEQRLEGTYIDPAANSESTAADQAT
ncbi:MAG: hypothetical protein KJO09_08275 [Gammaproteobacteria bacterium]|nr:hypothetical protein [Gammaproteobacteria bacterium]